MSLEIKNVEVISSNEINEEKRKIIEKDISH